MRARGIDPGDTIGWCDIERESAGVFRYVASGECSAIDIPRGGLALPGGRLEGVAVVSIETPEEMHTNDIRAGAAHGFGTIVSTIRNLLVTRAMAERVACLVADECVRVVEPTAAEVRRALGVKLGAQRGKGPKLTADQQIAHIIPLAVRGWPKRSNPHVRDATPRTAGGRRRCAGAQRCTAVTLRTWCGWPATPTRRGSFSRRTTRSSHSPSQTRRPPPRAVSPGRSIRGEEARRRPARGTA